MPQFSTRFDTHLHHIHLEFFVTDTMGIRHSVAGILDTGAPRTEFSDRFLAAIGLVGKTSLDSEMRVGLQTHKYGKTIIPRVEICQHTMTELEVIVSYFDESWGVDALVGLDFFRENYVGIDYSRGVIVSEPFAIWSEP